MTDNEIIKALECCISGYCIANNCPLYDEADGNDIWACTSKLSKHSLDLINRQKAEIEYFKNSPIIRIFDQWRADVEAEAIKDFAERLKKKAIHPYLELSVQAVFLEDIDNLVKEMVGDNK